MNDIFRLALAILLLTITLTSYFVVLGALFANPVTKAQANIKLMPGRSFGLGLVNLLFFGLIAIVLLSLADKAGPVIKGILTIPALLILAILTIFLSFGLTAVAQHIGERLFPDVTSWKRNLWSAILLCIACALPFVGWFLLFPYVGFVGVGATILSLFQRS